MKKMICFMLSVLMCVMPAQAALAVEGQPDLGISAPHALLMEASSGEILYENAPDDRVPIASVTKIMTMLLIMEAMEAGKFDANTLVPVSERAMSMGGSTMFLETGEQLPVHDMLKGIAVASANDGCVAMAEFIAGSESAFVEMMNKKAKELGMENTNFVNTNGLDDDNHYSSARDVALMSRELIRHEAIFEYTTIWTDSLRDGKFSLANTNKLIRFYDGANGLKTGSTSKAKCCLSATAKRDNMQLIAVVLGAPTSNDRFKDARALLDYGFSACSVEEQVKEGEILGEVMVRNGVTNSVKAVAKTGFSTLVKKGTESGIEREVWIEPSVKAPVYHGDTVGKLTLTKDGQILSEIDIMAAESVEAKGFSEILMETVQRLFI